MKLGSKVSVATLSLFMLGGVSAIHHSAHASQIRTAASQNVTVTHQPQNPMIRQQPASTFKGSPRKNLKTVTSDPRNLQHQTPVREQKPIVRPKRTVQIETVHSQTRTRTQNNQLGAAKGIIRGGYQNQAWFKDGLSRRNLRARNWISAHESGHRWDVLSYGGRCIGYFQLDPAYLGKRHGHVNLKPAHQVKIADAYVRARYGSWVRAQSFWQIHHWY